MNIIFANKADIDGIGVVASPDRKTLTIKEDNVPGSIGIIYEPCCTSIEENQCKGCDLVDEQHKLIVLNKVD